jgi:hypothetical protein
MKHPAFQSRINNLKFKIKHKLFILERKWLCHPFYHWFYPRPGFARRLIGSLLAFLILVPLILIIFRPGAIEAAWYL